MRRNTQSRLLRSVIGQQATPAAAGEARSARTVKPYVVHQGCICAVSRGRFVPLCNFSASIKEQIVVDDGQETKFVFVIEGRKPEGKPLPTIRVTAERFSGMSWVTEEWGVAAIVTSGAGRKDKLREAIQWLSQGARKRLVFSHTGWRQIGGRWLYLTASGAVGDASVAVDLPEDLERISLPTTPNDLANATKASLSLLEVAPLPITVPILAAVYRAPLCSFLPCNVSLWLEGVTGSLKSTLAALAQGHWGDYEDQSFPGSWSSTENQLEQRAFTLQDVLFVVNDYAQNRGNRQELARKASRLLRAQGNLSGKGRLGQDLKELPTRTPRGIVLGTGEQHLAERSIVARMLIIEMSRGDVDLAQLTSLQARADRLPHAMAGYVEWLTPQIPSLRQELEGGFLAARERAMVGARHMRIASTVAHLFLGLKYFLRYAEEIHAIEPSRREELGNRGWEALTHQAQETGRLVAEERPVLKFLELLLELRRQGMIRDSSEQLVGLLGGEDVSSIGWFDNDYLYLHPAVAYQAVNRLARDIGEEMALSDSQLRQELKREGLTVFEEGRLTSNVRTGDSITRVLKIKRDRVKDLLGEDLV